MAVAEGLDLASSYAYSDSITDLPMLELVGNPVAVNPDRELARIAREREWEVRYFQRPVRLRDRVPVPPKGPTLAAGGVAIAAGTAVGVYVWLRKRAAVRPEARERERACARSVFDTSHTPECSGPRAQAARTFLAMTAPSATSTRSNSNFFTINLLLTTTMRP